MRKIVISECKGGSSGIWMKEGEVIEFEEKINGIETIK